jgi:2-polyprenyl-6-hydroxyphenyl methylase/3-demethylubiquinone-9 3-methyltransferase
MLRKDTLKTRDPAAPTSDAAEIAKFNALAEEWWNPNGKFKVVHAFNAARVSYLIPHIASQLGGPRDADRPLDGIRIADIGCGAGLVSEPLASAGAHVFAIDAAERNVAIARHHAAQSGVDTIAYETALPEQLGSDHTGAYDAVLSLEVVEHVAGVDAFLAALARLVRPGGIMVIGTLNRTAKSFAFGIVGAEYVLRLLPVGTHAWSKFVRPSELDTALGPHGFTREALAGVSMNPITWSWSIGNDTAVNYLATLRKTR